MKTAPPPTKPGAKKLSELARKVVAPSGIASTGWPGVRDTCVRKLGITFDPWQEGAGRLILAKRADGKLAAMIGGVGLSVPRQVGKTYLLAAIIFALCILRPGLLVIWSAHHARTHGETFLAMQAFANRSKVKPYIQNVFKGSGDEEIRFRNGSRLLFGARERGFGRGIPGVDVIVSDEAQIMTDKALDAQLATMNTSQFGLAVFVGTPPRPEDPSEAFTRMRSEAWAGTLEDAVWIELGADPKADPGDRRQWATANPSFPHRTPVESMLRLQRKLTAASFLREGLGIWDEDDGPGALPVGVWLELADPDAGRGLSPVFGVDIAEDRTAWISAAWRRQDGSAHVMLANEGHALPAFRVVEECARLSEQWNAVVVPPRAFEDELEREGVRIQKMTATEFPAACGAVADAVTSRTVRHGNQPALNEAVRAAKWRSSGTTGERAFQLKDCPEVGPLAAMTRALHGLAIAANYDVLASAW